MFKILQAKLRQYMNCELFKLDWWVGWMASPFDGHECEQDSEIGDKTGKPGMLRPMGSQRVGHNWANEMNWTKKRQRNQRSTCQHALDHQRIKRAPEKHLLLLYWLWKTFDCVDNSKLWDILKDMGIPDHLTCPLTNLYAGQEATVRTRHGTADWFQIWKRIGQGCILSPCLFSFYAEFIMWKSGLDEA